MKDVRVLRGEPELVSAAEAAVRGWVFQPGTIKGRPVAVIQTVVLTAK